MLPIPHSLLVAALAGVLLALIVATATQRWQFRVFALLALRLAIGWHFLFEGMHKLHSFEVGPTETTRQFTSAPFMAVGEGPLAELMRHKYIGDPEKDYTERLAQLKTVTPKEFGEMTPAERAGLCPTAAAKILTDAANAAAPKLQQDLEKAQAEKEKLKELKPAEGKEAQFELEKKEKETAAKLKIDEVEKKIKAAANGGESLKADYAAWVYGYAPPVWAAKDSKLVTKIAFISGDPLNLTGPQRLQHIDMLAKELKSLEERGEFKLGRGEGLELAKVKAARTELQTAKSDLAKDTAEYLTTLVKSVNGEWTPPTKKDDLRMSDKITAWVITGIGAGLLLGFLTPLCCLGGIGFLVMTWLINPTVPWLTLPPQTEGNPVFINKNLIEALALLAVLAHPTGRWLGLDSLWTWMLFGRKREV